MNFITEPSVELIAETSLRVYDVCDFLSAKGYKNVVGKFDAENRCTLLEIAGRTCYMSFDKGRPHEDFIKHIIEVGHGSVLEHIQFTFQIWGISRSLSHELVRHRAGFAFSQLSQRYVDSSDVNFIVPAAIREYSEENGSTMEDAFQQFCTDASALYSDFTEQLYLYYSNIEDKTERRKKARQAARSILPNATETVMTVSMNARAFRHFVEMRANSAAEVEIRALAVKIFDIINEKYPLLCHGMQKEIWTDGSTIVTSKWRKV